MKEKDSSKKGFAWAMAYAAPSRAKFGQRISQRLAMANAWPIRAVRSDLRWRSSKASSQGPSVLRKLIGRMALKGSPHGNGVGLPTQAKVSQANALPANAWPARAVRYWILGRVWNGVRMARDLMGFR